MKLYFSMVALVLGVFVIAVIPCRAGGDPAAACKVAKTKAAGKKAADILKAFGKNEKRSDDAKLAGNISRARSKFTTAFLREDSKGGCSTTGDAGAVELVADSFVTEVLGLLSSALPPCDADAWPTCGGACPAGTHCGRSGSSDCGCVSAGTIPCGESTGSACDGSCPAGLACAEPSQGAGCQCLALQGACGEAAAPECGGECPASAPYCVDTGSGACGCSASLSCEGTVPVCDDPGLCTNTGLTCGVYGALCECIANCGTYPSCTGNCAPTVGQVCSTDRMFERCVCVTATLGCNGESNPLRCRYEEYEDSCPPGMQCYSTPETGGCGCRII